MPTSVNTDMHIRTYIIRVHTYVRTDVCVYDV